MHELASVRFGAFLLCSANRLQFPVKPVRLLHYSC